VVTFSGLLAGCKGGQDQTQKKEKIKRKEGEPPDLLRRRKDVYFPALMITSGPTRIEAPERKFLQKLQLFLTPTFSCAECTLRLGRAAETPSQKM
jgi:hypothetical protein